ncbi:MAG: ABC transporter permease [Nitrososphaerota archaeon]|nr:ABC transporter permease [Nitrososphaerota archaeon]
MSVRVGLALLKAEIGKVWNRPILEITVALMVVLSVASIMPLTEIYTTGAFSVALQSAIIGSVSATMTALMLPLMLMCAVLVTLSFSRDYESGLMQSLLSVPISRRLVFIVKFVAVALPLVLLSWGITTFLWGLLFIQIFGLFYVFLFLFYLFPFYP